MRPLFFLPPPLRLPAALTAGTVGLAVLLAGAGLLSRQQAQAERDGAASRLRQMEAKMEQLQASLEDTRRRAELFLHLQAAGIVGAPNPPAWTRLLHELQQELRLPAMKYEFLPAGGGGGEFAVHTTPMRLQLQALHEGHLLDFLARLQRDARALVLVRRCQVARLPASPPQGEEPTAPQLSADCHIEWVTAHKRGKERS